jgi:hypothetical protein
MKRLSVLFVVLLFVSGCTTTPSAISKGELVNCASLSADSTVEGTKLDCLDGSAGIVLEGFSTEPAGVVADSKPIKPHKVKSVTLASIDVVEMLEIL